MILLARYNDNIIRQASQQIECSLHGFILLPQDDLIPSPKDLHFIALQSKLFRQPNRLTVSGTKNPRGAKPARCQ
jgi:hypothetical protein